MRRIVQIALALGLAFLLTGPATASAVTIRDTFPNTNTGKMKGTVTYSDCRAPCKDGMVGIATRPDGWHVRLRVQARVRGRFYNYLDKFVRDGYWGRYQAGYPPKGALIRVSVCFLDGNYRQRGRCIDNYTTNKNY